MDRHIQAATRPEGEDRRPRLRLFGRSKQPTQYHVVIAIMNGIGDAHLALPVIRYIVALFGPENVTVWATRLLAESALIGLECDLAMTMENNTNNARPYLRQEYTAFFTSLFKRQNEALLWVSLNSYFPRSDLENYAISQCRPYYFWGFFEGGPVFRDSKEGSTLHRRDQYFRVIGEPSTPKVIDRSPIVGKAAYIAAKRLLDASIRDRKGHVVIHVDSDLRKRWHYANWSRLISKLDALGWNITAIGTPPVSLLKHARPIILAPKGWEVHAALVILGDVFLGIDSCFAHIADSVSKRGIVLFGPTSIEEWGPRSNDLVPLLSPEHQMSKLTVDRVIHEFNKVVSKPVRYHADVG